jgi:hypothetical protein
MLARVRFRNRLRVAIACAVTAWCASDIDIARGADDEEEVPLPFHGPDVHPGYPDAFHVGFVLLSSALSPDKRYGIIYPRRFIGDTAGDFVVDVPGSRVLASVAADEPYFVGKNHGSIGFHWAPDSSAVLVENGGKWAPRNLLLIELKDGIVARQTDLLDALDRLFSPAIAKAEHTRARDASVDELSITDVRWKNGRGAQVEIACEGGTNPKGFAEQSAWSGKLVAIWDVAQRKFVQQKVTQTSFRKAGREEDE